jgi:hypothetical protein
MQLAIECVNDWAERIVNTNRSGTQSQKQEQEDEVQPEEKVQDEVIQVMEIKAQEEVDKQMFPKSVDIQNEP